MAASKEASKKNTMPMEDFMIKVFLIVDEFLQENDLEDVRERGPSPKITDSEVITMEIVGEALGHESDRVQLKVRGGNSGPTSF